MSPIARAVAAVAMLALAACAPACSTVTAPQAIVLVTLDTTRADRLGCYGDPRAATPVLDAIAAEGVRFDQAVSPVPVTLPAHASLFTGRYPTGHGVRYNGMFRLSPDELTLAEVLRAEGWSTAAFPAAFPLAGETGVGQGFDTFDDAFLSASGGSAGENERSAEAVTGAALAWLDTAKGSRFFIWIHYYDPHTPYAPPFPFSAEFRERPYDGEIAFVDRELGRVRAWLEGAGLWTRSLVLVVGDHGEGLWDHGEKTHQYLAYESTLRVPLIIRAPGAPRARVVTVPVSLVDVAPTILDLAEAAPLASSDGISLKDVLRRGEPPHRDLYFEALSGSLLHGWAPLEGFRRGTWKLIRSASSELYDLGADPGETTDVAGNEPGRVADLERDLTTTLARLTADATPVEAVATPLDTEEMDRLASLGYVGGTISTERRSGPSPRDRIHLETDLLIGGDLMRRKEFASALEVWQRVLEADPSSRYALLNAANAAARIGRTEDAARFAERLVAAYPEFLPGALLLGEIRIAEGEAAEAVAVFRDAATRHPSDPGVAYRLALASLQADRVDEAASVVDRVIDTATSTTDTAAFLVVRSLCRARSGDAVGAERALRDAIAAGYADREILETEPMLAPLRALPGVRAMIATLPEAGS